MIIRLLILLTLCGALGFTVWTRLSASGAGFGSSAALSVLAVAQPELVFGTKTIPAVAFALCASMALAGILRFARQQDARLVVLLGTSLAGAGIVSPLGGALTLAAVPFAFPMAGSARAPSRTFGLLVLLLFLPVLAGLVLTWLWFARHFAIPDWIALIGGGTQRRVGSQIYLLLLFLPLAPALAYSAALQVRSAAVVFLAATSLCLTALVLRLWGSGDYSLPLLACAAPFSLLLMADLPDTSSLPALACGTCGAVLSWAAAFGTKAV